VSAEREPEETERNEKRDAELRLVGIDVLGGRTGFVFYTPDLTLKEKARNRCYFAYN
jgi:hypothetical protein